MNRPDRGGAPAGTGKARKVLLVNDRMGGGGAERSMAILANALAVTGRYRISVLSLEDDWGYPLDPSIERLTLRGRYRGGQAGKALALLGDALRLRRLVVAEGFETVLSFCYRSCFVNALSKALGGPQRCIVSERNYPLTYFKNERFGGIARGLIRGLYNRADVVTCNGSEARESLERDFGIRRPIVVIPNGYDVEEIRRLSREPVDPGDEALVAPDVRRVVYVSRMAPNKGHRDLLDAWARLREPSRYRLLLIGDGPCEPDLRERVLREGWQERVHFLGRKTNPFRYLARSDVFVMPSYYEGYPNALAEALICGLACVAYSFKAGARDLLGDGLAGTLVPLADVDALSRAIETAENRSGNARISSVTDLTTAYEAVLRGEETTARPSGQGGREAATEAAG